MAQVPWRQPPLTPAQANDLYMLLLEDDTEDSPWMLMGDLEFWATSNFAQALQLHTYERNLGWYVTGRLPIGYRWPGSSRRRVLAPDALVAFVPDHPRSSFEVEVEGGFPSFVLEVVSPSSGERDWEEKRLAYDLLGAREYALFTPVTDGASTLAGYRRAPDGQFVDWSPNAQGRLWSEVLGLWLGVQGRHVRAWTREGVILPTLEEATAEVERLRAELERLRGTPPDRT